LVVQTLTSKSFLILITILFENRSNDLTPLPANTFFDLIKDTLLQDERLHLLELIIKAGLEEVQQLVRALEITTNKRKELCH
jgi:hypothetical protein